MRLLFVGDVMLGRVVNETLRHKPPEYPSGGYAAAVSARGPAHLQPGVRDLRSRRALGGYPESLPFPVGRQEYRGPARIPH